MKILVIEDEKLLAASIQAMLERKGFQVEAVYDGETVEILEGLAQGQTYYYAYYDTLEISFTPDFGRGGLFGR